MGGNTPRISNIADKQPVINNAAIPVVSGKNHNQVGFSSKRDAAIDPFTLFKRA